MQNIADLVRFYRKQSGLTQLQLAHIAGVGKTVIFDIEHGKETVQLSTLLKVFDVLNIKITFEAPLLNSMDNHK